MDTERFECKKGVRYKAKAIRYSKKIVESAFPRALRRTPLTTIIFEP